jgi:hypothetical protein
MAHNPILGRYTIGLIDNLVIQENQKGLLYINHNQIRILEPGEAPTMAEKASAVFKGQEIAVYIIDLKPHPFDWRINLPSKLYGDYFNTSIGMTYKVVEPKQIVDDGIEDTEALLLRYLDAELRRISREFSLNKYVDAADAFSEFINQKADFRSLCKIEMVSRADVQIYLSDEQRNRIKEIEELERGLRIQQLYEFKDEVPSKDSPHRFEVYVQIIYRVSNRDDLTSNNLNEVVSNLKPRILSYLRKEGRKYEITQLAQADEGMQNTLDDSLVTLSLFGLEVISISVSTDLNEEARKRYLEKIEITHKSNMETLVMKGVEESAEVINGLIKRGNWAVLAMAVSRNEITTEQLYHLLNEQQREHFTRQMEVLEKFSSGNKLNEDIFYKQSARVAEDVTDSIIGVVTNDPRSLKEGEKNPELPIGPNTAI